MAIERDGKKSDVRRLNSGGWLPAGAHRSPRPGTFGPYRTVTPGPRYWTRSCVGPESGREFPAGGSPGLFNRDRLARIAAWWPVVCNRTPGVVRLPLDALAVRRARGHSALTEWFPRSVLTGRARSGPRSVGVTQSVAPRPRMRRRPLSPKSGRWKVELDSDSPPPSWAEGLASRRARCSVGSSFQNRFDCVSSGFLVSVITRRVRPRPSRIGSVRSTGLLGAARRYRLAGPVRRVYWNALFIFDFGIPARRACEACPAGPGRFRERVGVGVKCRRNPALLSVDLGESSLPL